MEAPFTVSSMHYRCDIVPIEKCSLSLDVITNHNFLVTQV